MNSSHFHPKKNPAPRPAGFTLVELLVVITVIALLAGLTLAAVGGVNQKANRDKTKAEIAAICNALEQYKSINDIYPPAGAGGTVPFASSGNATIQPFFIANKISTNTTGQLIDSYGNAFLYQVPGTKTQPPSMSGAPAKTAVAPPPMTSATGKMKADPHTKTQSHEGNPSQRSAPTLHQTPCSLCPRWLTPPPSADRLSNPTRHEPHRLY